MARGGQLCCDLELAMCLVWSLTRVLRVSRGNAVRDLLLGYVE